jgi:hypothetical protein
VPDSVNAARSYSRRGSGIIFRPVMTGEIALTQTTQTLEVLASAAELQVQISVGYLVAAYLIGKSLTRVQAFVLNAFYIWWSCGAILNILGAHNAGQFQYQELLMIDPDRVMPSFWRAETAYFTAASWALVVLASLWFMWEVHRPEAAGRQSTTSSRFSGTESRLGHRRPAHVVAKACYGTPCSRNTFRLVSASESTYVTSSTRYSSGTRSSLHLAMAAYTCDARIPEPQRTSYRSLAPGLRATR